MCVRAGCVKIMTASHCSSCWPSRQRARSIALLCVGLLHASCPAGTSIITITHSACCVSSEISAPVLQATLQQPPPGPHASANLCARAANGQRSNLLCAARRGHSCWRAAARAARGLHQNNRRRPRAAVFLGRALGVQKPRGGLPDSVIGLHRFPRHEPRPACAGGERRLRIRLRASSRALLRATRARRREQDCTLLSLRQEEARVVRQPEHRAQLAFL